MNVLYSLGRYLRRTSGYDTADRDAAGALPALPQPRTEPNELTDNIRAVLIAQSRHQVRNNGLLAEVVNMTELYTIGDGITAQPTSDDEAWNDKAAALWNEWSRRPDITGKCSMLEVQGHVCRSLDTDGEIFVMKVYRGGRPYIQLIEAPCVASGVDLRGRQYKAIETDGYGRPKSYNIREGEGHQNIAADNMLHVAMFARPSSVRGTPTLHHTVGPLSDLGTLTELEKRKMAAHSGISVAIKKEEYEEDEDMTGGSNPADEESRNKAMDAAVKANLGGMVLRLNEGEDVTPLTTSTPGSGYVDFRGELFRESCLGLLPYEIVADPSKIGGASVRLVVSKAGRYFARRQQLIIDKMLTPLYVWFIAHCITTGKLPLVSGWLNVEWQVPQKITVDAGRDEANARENALAGLLPIEDYFAEKGLNAHRELAKNDKFLRAVQEKAVAGNYPPAVLWRGFANTSGMPADSTSQQPAPDDDTEQHQTNNRK